MAKVFEALQQSSVIEPEYAGRFLQTFNFTHVLEAPADYRPPALLPAATEHGACDCDMCRRQAEEVNSYIDAETIDGLDEVDEVEPAPDEFEGARPASQVILHPSATTLLNPMPQELREEFRRLRGSVLLAAESRRLQVVLVCGVEPGDGASFVAGNLSLALAEFDKLNVGRFELAGEATCAPVEVSSQAQEGYQLTLRRTEIPNLREITTPQGGIKLHDLLRLCDIPAMVEKLRSRFDYVLIDAPAVTAHAEVVLLASQVDAVILVAQQDETKHAQLEAARSALEGARAQVLGVVLNRRREYLPKPFARVG